MRTLLDVVLPAAPDFSWDHATTGEQDAQGYVLVIVAVGLMGCWQAVIWQVLRQVLGTRLPGRSIAPAAR